MAAEHYPALQVSRFVNTDSSVIPQGYYRSKLFIAPYAANRLVAAAGPLLSLLERLCLSQSLPPIARIRDNLDHELRAFYSKLKAAEYSTELMHIAHYLLSATIDEIIGKSYLRIYQQAPEFNSFTPLTSDGAQPQQRFFEIMNYVVEHPNHYLDLIELIYFCLVVGFEGEYHLKADGRQSLDNHIEHLYQMIQQYRHNQTHRLFHEHSIAKVAKKNYKATVLTISVALGLVTAVFFTGHILLENKARTVLFGHTQLALLDN